MAQDLLDRGVCNGGTKGALPSKGKGGKFNFFSNLFAYLKVKTRKERGKFPQSDLLFQIFAQFFNREWGRDSRTKEGLLSLKQNSDLSPYPQLDS